MRRHRAGVLVFLMIFFTAMLPAGAQNAGNAPRGTDLQGRQQTAVPPPFQVAANDAEMDMRTRINNWAVTILGGYNTGVLIRMAVDIQTAFEDGDNLRILPVVSHGAKQNVLDLL